MRERTVIEREGEDMGPIDWTHELARDMPPIWREAEKNPRAYLIDTGSMTRFRILAIRMYDGWPYWEPTPAILFAGPIGPEWRNFGAYGIRPSSIVGPINFGNGGEGGEP